MGEPLENLRGAHVGRRERNIPGWHEAAWSHVERLRACVVTADVPHLTVDTMERDRIESPTPGSKSHIAV